jgi:hypothetical protein
MTRRHAVWSALAACHLGLVGLGAARLSPLPPEGGGRALASYGAFSGSGNAYGFFAPSVASQVRADCALYDLAGGSWAGGPEPDGNREVELRLSTLRGQLAVPEGRELLAASWATAELARRPEARLCVVQAQVYRMPSMADYRRGVRPTWLPFDEFGFFRAGADEMED